MSAHPESSPRVIVVTVNYRSARLALDALRSLVDERKRLPGLRAVVVDNASGDDSLSILREGIAGERFGDWVQLLPMAHNGGFGAGNNAGIRYALDTLGPQDYFMLLNPDTLVRPGAIATLVDFMESHPAVGITGGSLEDGRGEPFSAAHPFPHPLGELSQGARLGLLDRLVRRHVSTRVAEMTTPEPYDWVSGASLMLRAEVFDQIGGMDEAYFLYFEEVDYCYRAKQAGWQVWNVPAARVVHKEGSTTGLPASDLRRSPHWFDSRRRFLISAYGVVGLLLADSLWGLGRLLFQTRRLLGLAERGPDASGFPHELLWRDVRALLRADSSGGEAAGS